jgi:phosphinothricin acetyltransferase
MDEVTVRMATEADLPAVREIYNFYVRTSTCTFQEKEDTEAERLAWFRGRGPAHAVIVAEKAGEVVAWASLSPWNRRSGYVKSAEASVYVKEGMHRRGLGRRLLEELIELGRAAGLHTILGGACTEQPASIALQEALGFVRVAHFRETGRKFGRWLDVVYLQLML